MQANEKIIYVRDLLMQYLKRERLTGEELCGSLTKEEKIRRELDPNGTMYDRDKLMSDSLSERLKAVPFVSGKTQEEYKKDMDCWLPSTVVLFSDKTDRANVEGCTKAVIDVVSRYPRMINHLRVFASSNAVEARNKSLFDKKKFVEELLKDETFSNRMETEIGPIFDNAVNDFIRKRRTNDLTLASYFSMKNDAVVKKHICWSTITDGNDSFVKILKERYIYKQKRKAANKVADNQGGNVKKMYSPSFKPSEYACCAGGNMVYLSNRGRQDLHEPYDGDVKAGWHPAGTSFGARAIMVHELGHAMDGMLGVSDDSEVVAIWNQYTAMSEKDRFYGKLPELASELSEYACVSIHEMVAEGFCEFVLSPSPRKVASLIGKRLDAMYSDKFKEQPNWR